MRLRLAAGHHEAVAGAIGRARQDRVGERLLRRDGSLWPGDPGRWLGWVDAPVRMRDVAAEALALAGEALDGGMTDAVLLGMGGSSLAPEVLRRSGGGDGLRLHVLDSTHPDAVQAVLGRIDPERTLVVVASKSGGTLEVVSLRALLGDRIADRSRFIAITDPGTALADLAADEGYGRTFLGDPEIGGRFSALSPFGLVPAALAGVDPTALLARAAAVSVDDAVGLGAALAALADAGRDKLTLVVDPAFDGLGLWIEQLVAESSGKDGRGILPVADEPLGTPAAYGDDRVFVAIGAPDPALDALADAGHPVIELPAGDPFDLGGQFYAWEVAVAVACSALGVNAFDQPNVQEAKDRTKETIDAWRRDGVPPPGDGAGDADLEGLLDGLGPPGYLAVLAFLPESPEIGDALRRLGAGVRDARRCAVTVGLGPRYLHSTGQLHKGGPPNGRFLVLTADAGSDVEVPGAGHGFDALVRAQAAGDLAALRARDLPAVGVHLRGDPVRALEDLAQRLGAAR